MTVEWLHGALRNLTTEKLPVSVFEKMHALVNITCIFAYTLNLAQVSLVKYAKEES